MNFWDENKRYSTPFLSNSDCADTFAIASDNEGNFHLLKDIEFLRKAPEIDQQWKSNDQSDGVKTFGLCKKD